MSWYKIKKKANDHIPFEQMELTLTKCRHGRSLCLQTYKEIPDKSVAFLLFRLCTCYEEIIVLLEGRGHNVSNEREQDILQWLPETLANTFTNNLSSEKLGELLQFQQDLLYQLRLTISLLENRQVAFELSGSVATFQILHDYLTQFHSRVDSG